MLRGMCLVQAYMKPGYAKKKAKARAKKQANKSEKEKKKQQHDDGDEMMVDVEASNKGVDNQGAEVDYEMHDDGENAKAQAHTHKSKVEVRNVFI